MEKLGVQQPPNLEFKKRDIFTVYDENHMDALLPVEKPRIDPIEPNLMEVYELNLQEPKLEYKPVHFNAELLDDAVADQAQRDIRLAADVNDLLDLHMFKSAEVLLGRKLTDEEIRDQFVKDLLRPKESKETKILRQADEQVQTEMKEIEALKNGEEVPSGDDEDEFYDDDEEDEEYEDDVFHSPQKLPKSRRSSIGSTVTGSVTTGLPSGPVTSYAGSDAGTTVLAPTVLAPATSSTGPQGGTYELPLEKIFPDYNPDKTYKVKDAEALLDKWAVEYRGMKDPLLSRDSQPYALFKQRPKKKADLNELLKTASEEIVRWKHEQAVKAESINQDDDNASVIIHEASPSPKPETLTGNGISEKKWKAGWRQFGPRFLINEKKLKNDSVLSFIYPNTGQKPARLKTQPLSPEMQAAFLAYLNNEPMDTLSLTPEEQEYMKFVWTYTKMAKPVHKTPTYTMKPKPYTTKKEIQGRIKVLLGEFAAGNDSPKIFTEMKGLVKRLQREYNLSKEEINKYQKILGE